MATKAKHPGGRPTCRTPENRELILKAIRESAMPPTRAARLCAISPAALSEWRKEDPDFEEAIQQARSEFMQWGLDQIRQCKTKWGTPDAHALTWLMERSFPEEFGRKAEAPETNVNVNVGVSVTISPAQLEELQRRREAALRN